MPSSSKKGAGSVTTNEYLYETDETNRPRVLAYGILREPPAPFFSHQLVVLNVARLWSDHVDSRALGRVAVAPVDVVLDPDRHLIVQPDVLFIAASRLSIVRDQVWGAPDLVAEVMSPGTRSYDHDEKLGWYRQYGVREYWLVDIRTESVTVVEFAGAAAVERRARGGEAIRSSVLPELRAPVFRLFA
jgi:Uma2 family endonuclease